MPVLPDGTRLPYPGETQNQVQNQTQTQRQIQSQRVRQTTGTPAFADFARTFNRAFDHPIFRATNLPALTPNPEEQFGQFLQRYLQQLRAGLPGRGIGGAVSGGAPAPQVPATPGVAPAAVAPPPAMPPVAPLTTARGTPQPVLNALQTLVRRGAPDVMRRR